ncbi:MAG TPA: substrate-binding domain-containing protein, partial [Roseiflexaceae bacterium]|nr:substrate-binding domain-containing protein [Roseiflexaceae bacterium]
MHITPRHSYVHAHSGNRPPARWRVALLLVWFLLLGACGSSGAGGLTVTGSTSVTPFAEHLAELYQRAHPETAINIQGLGSSAGIRAALDGVAEIGMSSRDLEPEEADQLDQIIIARDALAVVVNPANPISGLSTEQIQDIFSG